MKAIILAAGMGMRLLPLTEKIPKSLISVNGRTILERIVENCVHAGTREFVIVVGHKKQSVYDAVSSIEARYPVKIECVENRDYGHTNTGVSLLLALERVHEHALVINGDDVFDWKILDRLVGPARTAIVVDNVKTLTGESFKVKIRSGLIELMGKDIPVEDSTGEFIGISTISEYDRDWVTEELRRIVAANRKQYYDFVFQRLSEIEPISVVFTDGMAWTEVDTREDLAFAEQISRSLG